MEKKLQKLKDEWNHLCCFSYNESKIRRVEEKMEELQILVDRNKKLKKVL
jgi:hypothetical protein